MVSGPSARPDFGPDSHMSDRRIPLTFIIPVFNRHEELARALVSLTAQGHADIAPVLQDAAAYNLSLLTDYPPETLTALKRLLRDIIARHPPP